MSRTPRPRHPIAAFTTLAALLLGTAALAAPEKGPAPVRESAAAEQVLDSLRDQPVALSMFLRQMPKGADLHNHLTGGVYAETFLQLAAGESACVDPVSDALSVGPCAAGQLPAAKVAGDAKLSGKVVNAQSMRGFVPGVESGHDHFFATFSKFEPVVGNHIGELFAEAADIGARDALDYQELMWSPGRPQITRLAQSPDYLAVAAGGDLDRMAAALAPGMAAAIAEARADTDAAESRRQEILACGTPQAHPGCRVTQHYLTQVIRVLPFDNVFAQTLFAYELAKADARFVGLNYVAPEDNPVALADYSRHMALLAWMRQRFPTVSLSLHAGELAEGLVPPSDLRDHIAQAVRVAGARRIGHGVDVGLEDDAAGLLSDMARRHVLVEINLTSNDVILGVAGDRHPLAVYRGAGVPVALSTDDQGVSRIDLTHEFVRAVREQRLGYRDLKTLVRNSLEYSFLPGASLWDGTSPYHLTAACQGGEGTDACAALLAGSEKARLQWRLEGELAAFEARFAAVKKG